MTTTPHLAYEREDGLTLIEVIVSLVLVALVMAGALPFFIDGLSSTRVQGQRQAAVQLANEALEATRAVSPSQLLTGRTSTAVSALMSVPRAAQLTSLDATSNNYDASATASSVATIPTTLSRVLGNTRYKVATFINPCWRPAGGSTCLATAASGSVALLRVTVDVAWAGSRGSGCGSGSCDYSASTLVDGHGELSFNGNLSTPLISAVSPNVVTVNRTGTLVIAGSSFLAGATVSVSGGAGVLGSVTANSGTQISVPLSAAGTAGSYSLTVVNPDGGRVTTSFTEAVAAVISSVSPGSIRGHGTTSTITITGTGFRPGVTVSATSATLGTATLTGSTSISVSITPANSGGPQLTLVVTEPDGSSASTTLGLT